MFLSRGWFIQILAALIFYGQDPRLNAADSHPNYFTHVWQTEDGLPQNTVTTVIQTRDGYLWLGTYNGLARFDGVQFTVFNDNNTPAFPNSRITSLFEADDGTLWIGHATGEVTRYEDGRFESVPVLARWNGGKIYDIASDENGDVWLLNEHGLLARIRDGLVLEPETGAAVGLVELTRSARGKIWVARNGRVSALIHEQLKPLEFSEASTNTFVMGIGASSDGGLWIISDAELKKWNAQTGIKNFGPAPMGAAPVHKLTETKGHRLAGGTSDHGFYLFQPSGGESWQFNRANGLPSDWVISLAEDREGEFWVGTGGGGLVAVREGIFQTPAPSDQWQNRPVLSVCAAHDGAVWVGTEGAGIYRLANGQWANFGTSAGLKNLYIWSVAEDAFGNLWAGTWGAGLFLWRDGQFISAPGLEDLTLPMPAILCSDHGGLWIGTTSGLLRYESETATWLRPTGPTSAALPDVRAMVESRDGKLWFGMSGNGLGIRDPSGNILQFRKSDGLSSDFIECLHLDGAGALWIGTSGGGLNRLKNGKFSVINKNEGLPNNVICHIEEDDQGFFWMSSHGGIIRASKAELDRCAEGTITNVHFLAYGINDGLPTLECSSGLQPAGCKTADGRLWFPTTKGLVTVLPRNVRTNELPPPVVIEKLLVDDQETASNNGNAAVEIPPARHRIEFQYTGLSFVAPEKVRFKYRLKGAETEWVEVGGKRTVTFNYIPPGHYAFQVIACNNDGIWNENGATLAFVVLPFFWQTAWFRFLAGALVILGSGGVVWLNMKRRMRHKLERLERQRAIEHERARIAHDIHDDLGSHLTRITMLSESARGELDSPAGAAADISQIYDTARNLTRAMDEIVWAVNPKHDTLESLASYLEKFAQDFLGVAGIRCRLDLPVQFPDWPLTADVRHNVFLAFKEAINNAVKHAAASEVRVSLKLAAGSFELVVEDNGRGFGFAPENKAGNGLDNMVLRLENLGGRCEIRSEPGRGTQVIFSVPKM